MGEKKGKGDKRAIEGRERLGEIGREGGRRGSMEGVRKPLGSERASEGYHR